MSAPVTIVTQAAVSQGAIGVEAVQPGAPQDLERLRELVSGISSQMEAGPSPGGVDVGSVSDSGFRSPGDAILDGISRMKQGYEESLDSIQNRLGALAEGDPMAIGNDFAETVALQLDVARWSMSVMGIDNSSKAGTNTIKELSKGG
ncbi:MAG: hypothetical protein P1U81_15645 [Verrucomicrobiales bacterium]|jgi:hypothetical protein|nr:hypothetical protein [bacterium]MDF2377672.1 hypothetical protein [Verrucomicrobiales bacterium]